MDSFAENQMGRDETPEPGRRANRMSKDRMDRLSREAGPTLVTLGSEQELLAVEQEPASEQVQAVVVDEEGPIEVPCMSVEESALIASHWERKKSAFMPVGDPYAEPDKSTPFIRQVLDSYCTCREAVAASKRLVLRTFPFLVWAPSINWSSLRADVIAGLTVGVMLIPQSMSYANIAGLQYKYGLYTSVLPVITYALMGTSRQLGVGPVAMVSLLVEVGLKGALTEEQCPAYCARPEAWLDPLAAV